MVALDNLSTGAVANIEHLFGHPGFTFAEQDVSRYIWVPGPVDAVLHFASPASPVDYLEMPIQTLKVGSLGTHNSLGLAKAKQARFLLASTSEVYGDPDIHPQPETYWGNVNPIGPRGVYDEAKRFAEALTMAYHRTHGLEVRIARIFNVYGPAHAPRRRPGGVQLPGAGAAGQAPHHLRRRHPDPQLLLRRRRDARPHRTARRRFHRPAQHRQPGGVHGGGAGLPGARGHGLGLLRSCSRTCRWTILASASPISPALAHELGWEPEIALREGLERTVGYFRHRLAAEGG